jgi:hypothetical protein
VSPERNTEPEEKWLEVWDHIQRLAYSSSAFDREAHYALQKLYLLLEPPSVRELRNRKETDQ